MRTNTRDIPRASTAEQIEHEAAHWVVRADRSTTPDEQRRLDAWLDASPRNRAAFLRIRAAWRRADKLRVLGS